MYLTGIRTFMCVHKNNLCFTIKISYLCMHQTCVLLGGFIINISKCHCETYRLSNASSLSNLVYDCSAPICNYIIMFSRWNGLCCLMNSNHNMAHKYSTINIQSCICKQARTCVWTDLVYHRMSTLLACVLWILCVDSWDLAQNFAQAHPINFKVLWLWSVIKWLLSILPLWITQKHNHLYPIFQQNIG